jgi:hypothetical protein
MKWLGHVRTERRDHPKLLTYTHYHHRNFANLEPLQFPIIDISRCTNYLPAILKGITHLSCYSDNVNNGVKKSAQTPAATASESG